MTREEIIDLIREEYDPKPKHWHDTDRWDDGVGGIADKILSLLSVSEKRAEEAESQLSQALRERDDARAECNATHAFIERDDDELCKLTRSTAELRGALEACDELNGELDRQLEGQRFEDPPDDAEFSFTLTAKQLRNFDQAIASALASSSTKET